MGHRLISMRTHTKRCPHPWLHTMEATDLPRCHRTAQMHILCSPRPITLQIQWSVYGISMRLGLGKRPRKLAQMRDWTGLKESPCTCATKWTRFSPGSMSLQSRGRRQRGWEAWPGRLFAAPTCLDFGARLGLGQERGSAEVVMVMEEAGVPHSEIC